MIATHRLHKLIGIIFNGDPNMGLNNSFSYLFMQKNSRGIQLVQKPSVYEKAPLGNRSIPLFMLRPVHL